MIPLSVEAVADIVGGEVLHPSGVQVTGVSIDSRNVFPGDLFIPLVGEHTDGHHYIDQAMDAGAAAFLCAPDHADIADRHPGGIIVDDPLDALTGLGTWLRDTVDPVVVAITGSNGKTTTKDMTAAAISRDKVVVANPGSFNNELGIPLTLCLLTRDTEVLVCEIGARGIGHIAAVMPVLRPDIAIVTTVTGAHIGEFGSLEAIVQAKGELVEGLGEDGVAILNADVPEVAGMAARAPGRVVTFGLHPDADEHPDDVTFDALARASFVVDGQRVTMPRPGAHQVSNALAAIAAAEVVGVRRAVAALGVAEAGVSRWRMEVRTSPGGVVVVNDAYNANPQSMMAALDTLELMATSGRRWAVLGYMAELGAHASEGHRQVGTHAAGLGLDVLVVVEPRAEEIADAAVEAGFAGRVERVPDSAAARDLVLGGSGAQDIVLVKASRSVGLESVADALLAEAATS